MMIQELTGSERVVVVVVVGGARLRSVPVCSDATPFIAGTNMYEQKASGSRRARRNVPAWKPRPGFDDRRGGTCFMFGSKLLRDFDDVPRNNSGVCLRAVICGQMHSLVLITFNFMYHFVLSRSFLFIYFFALLDFDHRMQDLKETISLISKHPSIPNSKYIILSLCVLYNCPPKILTRTVKGIISHRILSGAQTSEQLPLMSLLLSLLTNCCFIRRAKCGLCCRQQPPRAPFYLW